MKFAFGINVYNEVYQLEECMGYLRAAYPDAPVCILADRDSQNYRRFAQLPTSEGGAYCVARQGRERLRPHPDGGRWLERFFDFLLQESGDADYLIKIDPDTLILRPLSFMPDADIVGFTRPRIDLRRGSDQARFVTLAFCAVRREAAQKILSSGILIDKRFADSYYDGDSHAGMETGEHLSIASWILADAARELGLSIAHHPEVYLRWRADVPHEVWPEFSVVNIESSPWGKNATVRVRASSASLRL